MTVARRAAARGAELHLLCRTVPDESSYGRWPRFFKGARMSQPTFEPGHSGALRTSESALFDIELGHLRDACHRTL